MILTVKTNELRDENEERIYCTHARVSVSSTAQVTIDLLFGFVVRLFVDMKLGQQHKHDTNTRKKRRRHMKKTIDIHITNM